MLTNSWRLAANFNWADTTKNSLPIASSYKFKSQIIKVESLSSSVPNKWRRAGYLYQTVSSIPIVETAALVVPLNRQKILAVPKLYENYSFIFTPVSWLKNGLRVKIWEYTGPAIEQEIMEQLLFIS